MRSLTAFFFCVLASISSLFAAPPSSQETDRPAILGDFVEGKYTNKVLGIAWDLGPAWQVANPGEAEKWSRRFPRDLRLKFNSDQGTLLLSATWLEPDEKLEGVFKISLMGMRDAGVQLVGKAMISNLDGYEVLSQKLRLKSKAGEQFGVYRGFFVPGYYVAITQWGLQTTDENGEAILKNLHIQR
jgi:hypothetical protein